MNKKTLSVRSINELLGCLEGEKKLLYDKNYIEDLYVHYQMHEIQDEETIKTLGNMLSSKELLVLGPGSTIKKQSELIADYIEEKDPLVISINYIPERFKPDHIFLSNAKRYVQIATKLSKQKYSVIATSNVTGTNDSAFDYVLNFSNLMDSEAEIIDNSLIMFLKALIRMGVKKVTLAGFDGYSKRAHNYFDMEMQYDFVKDKAEYLNRYTTDFLAKTKDVLEVVFLTESHYGD